jgi:GNAT superfamily N-acetyltransferase
LKGFSHKGYTLRRVIREDQDWGKGRMSFDILDRNGKKVGWGDFQMDVYSRGKIEIYNIHVDRAHQGKGIGRALIKMFVKEGKKLGATGLSLTASSFPASDKYGGDQGAAVWGKLGFKFSKWADLAALAVTMESFAAQTGHKWPRGLVKRVRDRKATIQEVMDADPGNFLTGELMPVEWDGVLDFSRLSLTASAQDQMVSLSAVGDAAEKYLSPRNGR